MRTQTPYFDVNCNLQLGERLAQARKRAGLAQVELAVAMGDRYNQQMVSHIERGRSSLRLDGLVNAAKELDVTTDYLLGLTDYPGPGTQRGTYLENSVHTVSGKCVRYDELHEDSDVVGDSSDTHATGTHRPVPILEVASAAGGGSEVYDETPIGVMWFREDWLRRNGIDSTRCDVISVAGHSMEPTLPNGCSILVDRSRRELRNQHVYVMRNEDGLVVKRVEHRPKYGWLLISDNIIFSTEVMHENTDIIGEVRWYSETL